MVDFIDTHLHCWDRSLFHYAWLTGTTFPWRFTPASIGDTVSGAVGAVFVEADRSPAEAIAESAWAASIRDVGPPIQRVVAHAPIEAGASLAGDLLRLSELVPQTGGIRRLLQAESADFFADPEVTAGLVAVGKAGLVFDACVHAHQLKALVGLASRAPGTTVIVDHLGKPDMAGGWDGADERWRRDVANLARLPNVVMKLSGATPQGGNFAHTRPWVVSALEAFGTDRIVAGSDWPVSRVDGEGYSDWFDFVLNECGLSEVEALQVGVDNARRVYSIPG